MLKQWTLTPGRQKTDENLPQRHRNQTLKYPLTKKMISSTKKDGKLYIVY